MQSHRVREVEAGLPTISQTLVQLKNRIPPEMRKGVVQCDECEEVYVGDTGRILKKWISEHKQAVKRGDDCSARDE